MSEMAEIIGARGLPIDARVTRWGGALPQYDVGHLDRVARVRAAVGRAARPRVVRCRLRRCRGPRLRGLGASAADRILEHLETRGG